MQLFISRCHSNRAIEYPCCPGFDLSRASGGKLSAADDSRGGHFPRRRVCCDDGRRNVAPVVVVIAASAQPEVDPPTSRHVCGVPPPSKRPQVPPSPTKTVWYYYSGYQPPPAPKSLPTPPQPIPGLCEKGARRLQNVVRRIETFLKPRSGLKPSTDDSHAGDFLDDLLPFLGQVIRQCNHRVTILANESSSKENSSLSSLNLRLAGQRRCHGVRNDVVEYIKRVQLSRTRDSTSCSGHVLDRLNQALVESCTFAMLEHWDVLIRRWTVQCDVGKWNSHLGLHPTHQRPTVS
ncbi:hypothetical protein H257_00025 [Aphanomyces astaci]|uniref:Uncharacterized protein n=1 Tax=Aphanomyces astaci TaxID=112090 RepID=W4HA01_APHAT|nr:hypothetical protein H257_00025 [Aphanomyces astaci]ETV88401.1 hypothetical protein H257_00025 [Aphanomyces astaci]|eukprot:XP_009820801.1 hypothetical protein H257_00025 [Aphanomyces astaci]